MTTKLTDREIYEHLLKGGKVRCGKSVYVLLNDRLCSKYDTASWNVANDSWESCENVSLLPIKKRVKYLKSIKQLLEEFPEAHWDAQGDLVCSDWEEEITSKMFPCFGERFEDRDMEYEYISCWIEEREEEK